MNVQSFGAIKPRLTTLADDHVQGSQVLKSSGVNLVTILKIECK